RSSSSAQLLCLTMTTPTNPYHFFTVRRVMRAVLFSHQPCEDHPLKKNLFATLVLCGLPASLPAQDTKFEVYGYVMTDAGYNFNQIQSDWFDVVRPTKLP